MFLSFPICLRLDALPSKALLYFLSPAPEPGRAKEKSTKYTSLFQGHFIYKNISEVRPLPSFSPTLLGDTRMLYFWFSEQVLNSLAKVAFQDGRLQLNLAEAELGVRGRLDCWDNHGCGGLHAFIPTQDWEEPKGNFGCRSEEP